MENRCSKDCEIVSARASRSPIPDFQCSNVAIITDLIYNHGIFLSDRGSCLFPLRQNPDPFTQIRVSYSSSSFEKNVMFSGVVRLGRRRFYVL